MLSRQPLLAAGVAVPLLYFATVLAASALYPGYSHATQYASELGMEGQPSGWLFNGGIVLSGLLLVVASYGIFAALGGLRVSKLWAALGSVALALFGFGLVMGGLFPMPDPRHGGFGLGMAIHLAPIVLAIGLWPVDGRRKLSLYLLVTAGVMAALLAVMFGVGGFVKLANVGIFQRLYALTIFPWIGVLSYALARPHRGSLA